MKVNSVLPNIALRRFTEVDRGVAIDLRISLVKCSENTKGPGSIRRGNPFGQGAMVKKHELVHVLMYAACSTLHLHCVHYCTCWCTQHVVHGHLHCVHYCTSWYTQHVVHCHFHCVHYCTCWFTQHVVRCHLHCVHYCTCWCTQHVVRCHLHCVHYCTCWCT